MSELPIIKPEVPFIVGEFPVQRTLQELDGQAQCEGWMPEPRSMLMIRSSPWYEKPILHFVKEALPYDSFKKATRAARFPSYIFWRILDWGCGMHPDVRQWLTQHAGGSVTYALRTRQAACLESVYEAHMSAKGARSVPVAALSVTGCVDYAHRLFGFHPVTEISGLVSFLTAKANQGTDHVHDAVYFVSRGVTFLLQAGPAGRSLIDPHVPALRALALYLESRPEEGIMTQRSGYSDSSILGEARLGIQATLDAIDHHDPDRAIYLDGIWYPEDLDKIYRDLWNVALRDQTVQDFISEGQPEQALALMQHMLRSRKERFGPAHPQTIDCMTSLVLHFRQTRDFESAASIQRQILQLNGETGGADAPATIEAATRLGDLLLQTGHRQEAAALIRSALMAAERVLEPGHYITRHCRNALSKLLKNSTGRGRQGR